MVGRGHEERLVDARMVQIVGHGRDQRRHHFQRRQVPPHLQTSHRFVLTSKTDQAKRWLARPTRKSMKKIGFNSLNTTARVKQKKDDHL